MGHTAMREFRCFGGFSMSWYSRKVAGRGISSLSEESTGGLDVAARLRKNAVD